MTRQPDDRRVGQREKRRRSARTRRANSFEATVTRTHADRLAVIARTPAGSGGEAQSKVRALAALVDLGEQASPIAKDELRRLLEDVADSPPPGARGAQARLAAIEVLERLDQPPDDSGQEGRPPIR
jgi:hypothetical protein